MLRRFIGRSLLNPRVRSLRISSVHFSATEQTPEATKHEFQAETRKLLDIVAKSLYSDKEVKLFHPKITTLIILSRFLFAN